VGTGPWREKLPYLTTHNARSLHSSVKEMGKVWPEIIARGSSLNGNVKARLQNVRNHKEFLLAN
jgi:hypothetical protein